jgi:hypothetical protein
VSAFYDGMARTASRLIKDKGRALKVVKRAAGTSTDAGAADVAETRHDAFGVVADFPAEKVNGTSVLRGDKRVTLEAVDFAGEIAPGDALEFDGASHEVVGANRVAPGGTSLVWVAQVRS